jgi:uncharacterized protein YfkK (UPF0435 family)
LDIDKRKRWKMWIEEVREQLNMLNFGQITHLMNGECFKVLIYKYQS